MTLEEIQRQARCNHAAGILAAATFLAIRVLKSDPMIETHRPALVKAIRGLKDAKAELVKNCKGYQEPDDMIRIGGEYEQLR